MTDRRYESLGQFYEQIHAPALIDLRPAGQMGGSLFRVQQVGYADVSRFGAHFRRKVGTLGVAGGVKPRSARFAYSFARNERLEARVVSIFPSSQPGPQPRQMETAMKTLTFSAAAMLLASTALADVQTRTIIFQNEGV